MTPWHRELLPPKSEGVHETGSTPGPALNVRYAFDVPGKVKLAEQEPQSPIAPGAFIDTLREQADLPELAAFVSQYRSLSGKMYESRSVVRKGRVTAFRFRRVWWVSNLRYFVRRRLLALRKADSSSS